MSKLKFIYFILFLLANGCQKQQSFPTPDAYPVSEETLSKEIIRNQVNSDDAQNHPYVILISIDGFRYDYAEKYNATVLKSFQVSATYMKSSFPSKTFPNHYTIITGLYPGHHGLVSNTFYDRKKNQVYSIGDRKKVEDPDWYLGTPLWVLASKQQMVTASMFWVGSEAPIQGVLPTYYFKYDRSIPHSDRVNKVMQWLTLPKEGRPHFITLYFSFVDSKGHTFGPDSQEIEEVVKEIDTTIGDLMQKIEETGLPVNVIIVSDHGMLEISQNQQVDISNYIDLDKYTVTLNMPTMIYSEDEKEINNVFKELSKEDRIDVYKKENLPESFHYSTGSRIGDLVIMPKPPHTIVSRSFTPSPGKSTHGWDPAVTVEMGAIFYANGPSFRPELKIDPFENIHIYPLIAEILHLEYDESTIDGKKDVLQDILKTN